MMTITRSFRVERIFTTLEKDSIRRMTHDISSYKLGPYKITRDRSGSLWWETHTGLGSAKGGRCFVEGNLLILGPAEREASGFLKREFLEHLNRLPRWDETKYYCLSHALYESRTGVRVSFSKKVGQYRKEPLLAARPDRGAPGAPPRTSERRDRPDLISDAKCFFSTVGETAKKALRRVRRAGQRRRRPG